MFGRRFQGYRPATASATRRSGIKGQVHRVLIVCPDRRWLREDVPFDEIVETAAVIAGVETCLRIVHRDGWSVATYKAWCRRMLAETVFC
jgi:hypothetical protein